MSKGQNKLACALAKEGAGIAGDDRGKGKASEAGCSTSSSTPTESCIVCLEDRYPDEMFVVAVCKHHCCTECMKQHASTQIEQNQVPVRCPHEKCTNSLLPGECRMLLSPDMLEKLKARMAEADIPEADRVYCPYPNCSKLISKAELQHNQQAGSSSSSGQATKFGQVRCRACLRNFCVECKVPWHQWMSCSEYQELPSDLKAAEDAKLYKLAKNLKWQRCTKCNRYIELTEGCYHMTCV